MEPATSAARWRGAAVDALPGVGWLAAALLAFPGWEFGKYPNLAAAVARGEASADQVGDASPAYLALHLVLSPLGVRLLQTLAGAVAVSALLSTLRRTHGLVAGVVAATVLAGSRSWLAYSAVLEPELLIGSCTALGVALLSVAKRARGAAGAGVALGLAVALRPSGALLALLVLGWCAVARPWRWSVALLASLLVAAAAPTLALRALAGHDARTTMSFGQVFHQSHRPESLGFGATFPSLLKIVEAEAASGPHAPDHAHELYRELAKAVDPAVTSGFDAELYWARKALRFFEHHPAQLFFDWLHKTVHFVALPSDEYDVPAARALLERPIGVPIGWLMFAVAGAVLFTLASAPRAVGLWGAALLSGYGVALLFYVHGRYATGLMPAVAALIGIAAHELATHRRWRLAGLLAAPLLLALLPRVAWSRRMTERLSVIEQGGATAPRSRDEALQRYRAEQAAFPDLFWPTSPHGVGLDADGAGTAAAAAEEATRTYGVASPPDATLAAALWAQARQCPKALEVLAPVLDSGFAWALGDRSISPRLVASDCLVSLGRQGEALALLTKENDEHPGRLDTLARLVAAGDVGAGGDVAHAEAELFALHDEASARYVLAQVRRRWGDPQGALEDATRLRALWPAAAPFAEHERALALTKLGPPTAALVEAWANGLGPRAALHGQDELDELARTLSREAAPELAPLVERHWRKRGVAPYP